jgi:primosomal protein N' (replication factor Y)
MLYADIIIKQKSAKADKPYTYCVPEDLMETAQEGKRVLVPFGKYSKPEIGVIVSLSNTIEQPFKLKNIIDILDKEPLINKNLLELANWMKAEYLCSFSEAIQTVLPPGDFREVKSYITFARELIPEIELDSNQKKILSLLKAAGTICLEDVKATIGSKGLFKALQDLEDRKIIEIKFDVSKSAFGRRHRVVYRIEGYKEGALIIGSRADKQRIIWEELKNIDEIPLNILLQTVNTSLSVVKALESKGLITIIDKTIIETPIGRVIEKYSKIELNNDQEMIFDKITENSGGRFLIHGITGSGKTEIYLQLVEDMLNKGKDSIILVPEISLTPQTIDRFAGRFGDNVAILHSSLSQSERFDQWKRIKSGEYKIVVGARSAIFAPFQNLGLIVIDEEHENTYKSSVNPKYNTFEVASKRCSLEGCTLVLGTATPSVESYYLTKTGELSLLKLTQRATPMQLPEIQVIDMRDELALGNRTMLSRVLYEEITLSLEAKKQTIIFLNRRGYSGSVVCRSCGYVAKCRNCEVSMTHHKSTNRLRCHYCGNTKEVPMICPVCGSTYIKGFGVGTEKVEEALVKLFPNANIVRMDSDVVRNKGDYDRILASMKNGEIDILIGTQMISKGLDFPNVTLVGIIAADITLNLPDFRSPERSFQLVTQVAGRAGRGEIGGKVILQTYNPNHYSINYAKDADYLGFYDEEIKIRQLLKYPPFINLAVITVFGSNKYDVEKAVNSGYRLLIEILKGIDNLEITAPHPAPIERINNRYRYHIVLKFGYNIQIEIKNALNRVFNLDEGRIKKEDIKVSIDIDPSSIL